MRSLTGQRHVLATIGVLEDGKHPSIKVNVIGLIGQATGTLRLSLGDLLRGFALVRHVQSWTFVQDPSSSLSFYARNIWRM